MRLQVRERLTLQLKRIARIAIVILVRKVEWAIFGLYGPCVQSVSVHTELVRMASYLGVTTAFSHLFFFPWVSPD